MKKKIDKKRIKIDCLKCKVKFDIWLANSNFPEDIEERVKERFYQYCGICKDYESSPKDEGRVKKDKKEKKGRFGQA